MKKYILTTLMLLVLYGQAYFLGVNDWLALLFVFVTAIFLYVSLIKLHSGNRKMMRVNAKPGSWLYELLSKDTTIAMRLVALFSSLILSTILVVLVKGMVLQQGYLPFFVTIVIASLALYSFVNANVQSDLVDKNINSEIAQHGNELAKIFYAAIILNFMLSFAFSAYDTFEFKTSDISFSNFTDKAIASSYHKTATNQYSRIFINAYFLSDYIKVAFAKMFVDLFDLKDNFYGFYIVIFALNMFKLSAFSFSFVLLQKGFDGTAKLLLPIGKNSISRVAKIATLFFKRISDFVTRIVSKNTEEKGEPNEN
ncbi:MAG: hypothetical protein K0A92_01810 [Methyloprofundus sp.]|nr:hypothetical protein [Methyloprofundus sp.]